MLEVTLFLGYPIDNKLDAQLKAIDPKVKGLFISNDPHYLQEMTYNQTHYIGKYAGSLPNSSNLSMLEDHICSLLKKLLPDHTIQREALVLFPAITFDQ